MRTEQDKINRKEANQRYYKLEENKEQKRNYMKEYAKRPEVKAKAKEYYKNNKSYKYFNLESGEFSNSEEYYCIGGDLKDDFTKLIFPPVWV